MPRLLGVDLETTGLDVKTDRPVEVGICLWDADSKKPIVSCGFYLWDSSYPTLSVDAIKTHGIQSELLLEFGQPPKGIFTWIEGFITKYQPTAIVAHNGNAYDKPLLLNELKRLDLSCPQLESLHWIDTATDLPTYGKSRALTYMAADHGFLNPYAHRAQFDVMAMMKILSFYDLNEVIKNGKAPKVKLKGQLAMKEQDFETKKNWLKGRRYSWDSENKFWVKEFRDFEVELEKEEALKAGIKLIIGL